MPQRQWSSNLIPGRGGGCSGQGATTGDDNDVVLFSANIRDGINEFLRLARAQGYTRRGRLRDSLDNDSSREQLAAHRYEQDLNLWEGLKPKDEPDGE